MVENYPNPARLFYKQRDNLFLAFAKELKVPVHLFSQIKESQLSPLIFTMEQLKIKEKRNSVHDKGFELDLTTLSKHLPHLALLKQTLQFFQENKVSLSQLASSLESPLIQKIYTDCTLKEEDWLRILSNDKLDKQYVTIVTGFLQVLLPAVFEQLGFETNSFSELKLIFRKKSKAFSEQIFTFFNYDILKSIENQTWETGKEGERVFPTNENSFPEDLDEAKTKKSEIKNIQEKGKKQTIQTAQLRKNCDVIYLYIHEILKYIEGKEPSPQLKKDDTGEYFFENSKVSGVENIPLLLSIDTLLYTPYPDKNKILTIQHHIREINRITKHIPLEFYEILVKVFHIGSSFIFLHHRNFKVLERHYKNIVRAFWRETRKLEKKIVYQLVCSIDNIFSQITFFFEYYDDNVKKSMGESLARLKHIFLRGKKAYFGEKITSPTDFWLEFSMISNLRIRDKEENIRIFTLYKSLITITKIEEKTGQKKFYISLLDLYLIYKRLIYHGIQSEQKEYEAKIVVEINNLEKLIKKIEADTTLKREWTNDIKTIVQTFRDSLKTFTKKTEVVNV